MGRVGLLPVAAAAKVIVVWQEVDERLKGIALLRLHSLTIAMLPTYVD